MQRNARNLRLAKLLLVAMALFLLPTTEVHAGLRHSPTSTHGTTTPVTLRIPVSEGWNLISLPLIVPNGNVRVLFPSAISRAFAYEGSYIAEDALKYLAGYWLKFAAPETVTVSGDFDPLVTVSVARGWNMIGAPVRTPVHDFISFNPGITSSPFFGYSPDVGYSRIDTLEPGRAYWVKFNQVGKIVFDKVPQLLSPGDGMIDQPTMIRFQWDSLPNAATYHLQVASDSSFSQPLLLDDSLVAGTTSKFCVGYGVSCFWRVGASYAWGLRSGWSSTWRFTTAVPSDTLRWEFLGFPNQGGTPVYSMAVNPEDDSIVYVGTGSDFSAGKQGRIYRTTNLGLTWDTVVAGVTPLVISINPHHPEIVYAGLGTANATPPGILKTTDGGATWFWSHQGIYVDWETGVSVIVIDPHDPDTIFAGTNGFFGGYLYKTTDGGGHWFKPTSNDSINTIRCLAIHQDTTSIVYAVQFAGWLFRSSNGGTDWELRRLQTERAIDAIAIDPVDPQIMYMAGYADSETARKSTDGGWTWFTANLGLAGSWTGLFIRNCTREVFLLSSQGLYESSDLGSTWRTISNLPNGNPIERALESTDGSYLYIALANTGIFRARLISGGPP